MADTKLVKFKLEDGGTAVFEVADTDSGPRRVARGHDVEEATQELENALSAVKPVIKSLRNSLNDLNNPAETTVEFGLKLSASAGIVFAGVESEVNFKVALTWK